MASLCIFRISHAVYLPRSHFYDRATTMVHATTFRRFAPIRHPLASLPPFSALHTREGRVSHSAAPRKIAAKNLRRCSTYPPRRRKIFPAQFRKSRILYFNKRAILFDLLARRECDSHASRANYFAREKK